MPHYFNYELMKQLNGDKQMKDVWKLPAIAPWEKSCAKHPTQKPLSVLTSLILASTKPDAWILDPFTGSSTTGIAANLANRRFLGIDQETAFLEISKKRKLEIENPTTAALYKEKISGFNDKAEYSLFLNSEPDPEINVALGFYRSKELPDIENKNKFYFHAIEKNNIVQDFPIGILDAKILFIYSGGRSKASHFTGYYANIKNVVLKHKSKIKGKENSETEFYYEVELESNFMKNKNLKVELNPKSLLEDGGNKNIELFKQFLPASTTFKKVLAANFLTYI